ncbi:uncharacterized protein BDZ83DRAFT_617055, partial [Colletotrichum acutatum]
MNTKVFHASEIPDILLDNFNHNSNKTKTRITISYQTRTNGFPKPPPHSPEATPRNNHKTITLPNNNS